MGQLLNHETSCSTQPITIIQTNSRRVSKEYVVRGDRVSVVCARDGKRYERDLTSWSDMRANVLSRAKRIQQRDRAVAQDRAQCEFVI